MEQKLPSYSKRVVYASAIGVMISLGIGLGIYYFNPAGNNFVSQDYGKGLNLSLSVNSTLISTGQAIRIALYVDNTLQQMNNITHPSK